MSAPPSGSGSDDLGEFDDEELSGQSASDPEEARAAAEDALSQIESMADLDEDPDVGASETGRTTASGSSDQGAPEAETAAPSQSDTPEDQCENCGALLEGPYCSQCGQKAADRVVPVWHMLNEALEAVIELDMRVLWTLPKFLFLPGRLTKEYINGRRKRYIRPFRLYLFTTFVLFTVLALTAGQGFQLPFDPQMSPAQADTLQANSTVGQADTVATASSSSWIPGTPEQRQKWARQIQTNPDAINVQVGDAETEAQLEQVLRRKVPEALRNPRDFLGSLIDQGPYVMFVMLPLFAFLLKLLYIRRGRLYAEHLIFSLHVHAFSFVAFTLGILLGETDAAWLRTASGWIELSPLLYLVVAMAHVYEQGFIKSTIKAFFLMFVYTIILVTGGILLALAVVMLM